MSFKRMARSASVCMIALVVGVSGMQVPAMASAEPTEDLFVGFSTEPVKADMSKTVKVAAEPVDDSGQLKSEVVSNGEESAVESEVSEPAGADVQSEAPAPVGEEVAEAGKVPGVEADAETWSAPVTPGKWVVTPEKQVGTFAYNVKLETPVVGGVNGDETSMSYAVSITSDDIPAKTRVGGWVKVFRVANGGNPEELNSFYLISEMNDKPKTYYVTDKWVKGKSYSYYVTFTADANKVKYSWTDAVSETFTAAPYVRETKVTNNTFDGVTKTVASNKDYQLNATFYNEGISRNVYVQKYDTKTKKWVNVQTSPTGAVKRNILIGYTVPRSKVSESYRITAPATDFYSAYTSKSTTVNKKVPKYSVVSMDPNTSTAVPWKQRKIAYTVNVEGNNKTVFFQRKVGTGSWKTVAKTVSKGKTGSYSFNTVKGDSKSNNASTYYRVYIEADAQYDAGVSNTTRVNWENPNRYKGMQAEFYKYTKKYCPNVLVRLDGSIMKKDHKWGFAKVGSDMTTVYSKIPAKYRKTVANHECAHHLQSYSANKSGGWNKFSKYADKVYGKNGIERQADCMANLMSPNSYWPYGNYGCGGTKGTVAKKVLQGKAVL